jgi:L-malate glycosyltransferase
MMRRPSEPLHVLQLTHGLGLGGTERVVRDLAADLSGQGFRSSVYCLDGLGELGQELQNQGVRVEVLGRRSGLDLGLVWRLAKLYRQVHVDIVHAHQYTPYFYAASACLLTPGVPVVFTEHGRHYPDHVRLRRALYNQLLRPVSRYTAVCRATRERLVRLERIPSRAIQVIYNGVDLGADEPSRLAARNRLGIAPDTPVVLSVARIDRVKDFATLLRAATVARLSIPDLTLLIAGDGDPSYRAELLGLSRGLGLDTHLRFLGARRDIADLLAACDVFALTSLFEAASMTILEAMAAACPVVATAVGGNAELVVDGTTGILTRAGDVSEIAAALVQLLGDRAKARALGAAGRQRVVARFSRRAAVTAYRRLYEELAAA